LRTKSDSLPLQVQKSETIGAIAGGIAHDLNYVDERGGKALIPDFKKPPADFTNVEDLFRAVLKHEEFITESINEIVALTLEEKDYNTHNFLQWFVFEQVEEEASVKKILDKIRLVGTNNMYQFDRDILSLRTPAANSQANP
jgi:ferritin